MADHYWFLRYPNNKYLFCLPSSAQPWVRAWCGTQVKSDALFFLTITQKVDYQTAYILIAISFILGTPFFIFFGSLSDKIGRLPDHSCWLPDSRPHILPALWLVG